MGERLGVSRSTIARWHAQGEPTLLPEQIATVARAVYPADPALAAEIAASRGHTLEGLGVVSPPAPRAPPPPAPPPPPPAPPPLHPLVAETVLCAAAEVAGQPPSALRPIVLAAFERAKAVGLDVDDVLRGLTVLRGPAVARGAKSGT